MASITDDVLAFSYFLLNFIQTTAPKTGHVLHYNVDKEKIFMKSDIKKLKDIACQRTANVKLHNLSIRYISRNKAGFPLVISERKTKRGSGGAAKICRYTSAFILLRHRFLV